MIVYDCKPSTVIDTHCQHCKKNTYNQVCLGDVYKFFKRGGTNSVAGHAQVKGECTRYAAQTAAATGSSTKTTVDDTTTTAITSKVGIKDLLFVTIAITSI